MDHLIATYLFTNKECPLPGVGSLVVKNNSAKDDFTNRRIFSPNTFIEFNQDQSINHDLLINFISLHNKISSEDAEKQLKDYCIHIQSRLKNEAYFSLPDIGSFVVQPDGKIKFDEEKLPGYYFAPVIAEKVIHPQEEHSILVGDKESTNTEMAYFLNEEEEEKRSKWWIWAIVLFCISVTILLIYFNGSNDTNMLGNCIPIFS